MNATDQSATVFNLRLQRAVVQIWRLARSPKTTATLLLIVAVVILLRLIIPQQPNPNTPMSIWLATLPPAFESVGEGLFFFGFFRIFHSFLFWIPAALLLLNSLVALADFGAPSWCRARAGGDVSALEWQHPLALRYEHSVRLPEAPDDFLQSLKDKLIEKGFSIKDSLEENDRFVSASRWGRHWLAIITFYVGIVLLIVALVVSYYTLKSESIKLLPNTSESSELVAGNFDLAEIDASSQTGLLRFTPTAEDQAVQSIRWRLFVPTLFANRLILPTAINPVITVEATDSNGELRRLLPVREDLSPSDQLHLPLDQPDEPLYFLIPSASLTFQILPVATENGTDYNLQVRRGSESSPSENLTVQSGDAVQIDGLSINLIANHSLNFMIRRDPALPIYLVSLIMIVASGFLIFALPPWQVWLIPEVKGRGGQLYGVAEKLGSAKGIAEFLEQLLGGVDEAKVKGEEQT